MGVVVVFEVSRQVARRLSLAAELPAGHPAVFDEIGALVDGLPDPQWLCAEERAGSMSVVARLRDRFDAYLADLAAAADEHADARVLHAGSTGMLVAVATGANPQTGSVLVARGTALQHLPVVHAAFRAGRISAAHVGVITAEGPRIPTFAALEAEVVTIAEQVEPGELRRFLRLLAEQCRPQARDDQAQRLHAKRTLSLSETPDGMFRLDGYLDPVAGANLRDALAPLMARTGRDDPRTPKQRRADALTDLVAAGATNRHPLGVSQVSVLVDLEDLSAGDAGQLEDGSVLGTRMFDLLTCTAIVSVILGVHRRNVFVPLALARGKRGASTSQWRALIARDRGCIRCGRAPRYCQAHHIHHWAHGGKTDLSNLDHHFSNIRFTIGLWTRRNPHRTLPLRRVTPPGRLNSTHGERGSTNTATIPRCLSRASASDACWTKDEVPDEHRSHLHPHQQRPERRARRGHPAAP